MADVSLIILPVIQVVVVSSDVEVLFDFYPNLTPNMIGHPLPIGMIPKRLPVNKRRFRMLTATGQKPDIWYRKISV